MTTEELYFKLKSEATLPVGRLYYTFRNTQGIIQLCGGSICVVWENDDENISKIKNTELVEGFLFWNNSDEGMEFYKKNWPVIAEGLLGLTDLVFND